MLFDKYSEEPSKYPVGTGAARVERTSTDKVRHRGHMQNVLSFLIENQHRWVTSNELIPITHRFSASIHTLREHGHVIDRRRDNDGVFEWRYLRRVPMTRIKDDWQQRYYLCEHWRATRKRRLEYDGYACCHCRSTTGLNVHHWRYDLFNERLQDITTLCRQCHEYVHDTVTIAFPKSIPTEVYNRLV